MDLRDNIQEEKKKLSDLNIDTFGEIMDGVIRKSDCRLMVYKDAGSEEWQIRGAGCGAVMDFYIFINALEPIYLQMLKEMKGMIDAKLLAESLSDLLKGSLIDAAKKQEEGQYGTERQTAEEESAAENADDL